jgi:hypothetical protein
MAFDSNVLLDLEKAAQGKVSDTLYRELQGLVRNLRYQDCRAALAISELCWTGRNGQYRGDREASLMAAMDAWFDDRAVDALSPESVKCRWQTRLQYHQARPSDIRNLDMRRMVDVDYCCLLKLASLLLTVDGFKAKQRVELFQEYCRWADGVLGAVIATPLQIAFDGLVGSPQDNQYVRRLLKFGKKPLRDIWGAAWDLMMLWLSTDAVAAGEGFNPLGADPILVTADKGLLELRSHLIFLGLMRNAERVDDWRGFVAARYIWDSRLEAQGPAIRDTIMQLQQSVQARLGPEEGSLLGSNELDLEISRLEQEVVQLATPTVQPPAAQPAGRDGRERWWKRVGRWSL